DASRQYRDHAGKNAPRHPSHRALASGSEQRHSRPPAGRGVGSLSPPNDYSAPRIESAAIAPVGPPPAPIPYYPDYHVGRPGYHYGPVNPYPWPPPGPGHFR